MRIVLAGTHQEYAQWARENGYKPFLRYADHVCVISDVYKIRGVVLDSPDDIIPIGTFWDGETAAKLYNEACSRVRGGAA